MMAMNAGARAQDVEIIGDLGRELLKLLADLVAAERRQALQAQVEDGAGLRVRQAIGAVLVDAVARVGDQARSAAPCRGPASARPISASRAAVGIRRRCG